MSQNHPFQILGYHSCDKEVGEKVLNGQSPLMPSNNLWDWLGNGIYFWEQDPHRALDYAVEVAKGKQKNRKKIKTPFVIGAIIDLGSCLNLVESQSVAILKNAYQELDDTLAISGQKIPANIENQRRLDCAVIQYIHQSAKDAGYPSYDTVRSAFDEGAEVYPQANFSTKNHIQVCVINPAAIKRVFLPLPIEEFNPHLKP